MFLIAQASAADGLTLEKVVGDIPHDTAAMVVYALVLVFAFFIWRGSRKKPT